MATDRRRYHHWKNNEINYAASLWNAGKSCSEIATRLNERYEFDPPINTTTVQGLRQMYRDRFLKKRQPSANQRIPQEMIEYIKQCKLEGILHRYIAIRVTKKFNRPITKSGIGSIVHRTVRHMIKKENEKLESH